MKNRYNSWLREAFWLSVIVLPLLFVGCKKEGELKPEFDSVLYDIVQTDTFKLKTSVVREDSIASQVASHNLFGSYVDPVFGLTSAEIYSQVRLSSVNVDFGSPIQLDSVVLSLKYHDIYGSEANPLSIEVYEVLEDFDKSSTYYTNQSVNIGSLIGNKVFYPKVNDSVLVDTVMRAPQLRIPLNNTFGQSLLNESGSVNLEDNDNFLQFFKGFYLKNNTMGQASGEGSIVSFDMNSSTTKLTLYYTNTSTLENESYDFIINSECVKFSTFEHDYTGTDIEAHLQNNNPDTTLTYIQPLQGVKTKIEIPNIKDLRDEGPILINKAEITFTIKEYSDTTFSSPSSLAVVGIDDNGNQTFIADFLEGVDHYGGEKNEIERTYTFNVSRHLQELISGTTNNNGLYLITSGSIIRANRVILNSENSNVDEIKLNIIYSKL